MSPDLPEIREADATGRTAEIYAEIRAAVGLPLVNLVYRVLAASGDLESIWGELEPNLQSGSMAAAAAELTSLGTELPGGLISPAALRVAGIDEALRQRALTTVEAYVHSNPLNLVAVSALLEPGSRATARTSTGDTRPTRSWDLLPMADLADVETHVRALLDEMSEPLTAPGDALLVPSLFRHFAQHDCLLALLWTSIAPSVRSGAIAHAADIVLLRGQEAARHLPHPVNRLEQPGTRDVLQRFQFTISRMIVVSGLMRRAFSHDHNRSPSASG